MMGPSLRIFDWTFAVNSDTLYEIKLLAFFTGLLVLFLLAILLVWSLNAATLSELYTNPESFIIDENAAMISHVTVGVEYKVASAQAEADQEADSLQQTNDAQTTPDQLPAGTARSGYAPSPRNGGVWGTSTPAQPNPLAASLFTGARGRVSPSPSSVGRVSTVPWPSGTSARPGTQDGRPPASAAAARTRPAVVPQTPAYNGPATVRRGISISTPVDDAGGSSMASGVRSRGGGQDWATADRARLFRRERSEDSGHDATYDDGETMQPPPSTGRAGRFTHVYEEAGRPAVVHEPGGPHGQHDREYEVEEEGQGQDEGVLKVGPPPVEPVRDEDLPDHGHGQGVGDEDGLHLHRRRSSGDSWDGGSAGSAEAAGTGVSGAGARPGTAQPPRHPASPVAASKAGPHGSDSGARVRQRRGKGVDDEAPG